LDTLGEPKHITERRRTLEQIILTLKESLKVLQRDPDITAASTIDDSELSELLRQDKTTNKIASANNAVRPNPQQQQQQPRMMGAPNN